jgi:exopolysaccharide biosynthesis polyprenyl glycosylphosphotransferase
MVQCWASMSSHYHPRRVPPATSTNWEGLPLGTSAPVRSEGWHPPSRVSRRSLSPAREGAEGATPAWYERWSYRLPTSSEPRRPASSAVNGGSPPGISTERLRTPARRRAQLGRWLALGDAVVIAASSGLAYILRLAVGRLDLVRPFEHEIPAALAVIPLWLGLFYVAGAYRPEYLNAGGDAFRRFVAGVMAGVLALGFVSFLFNLQLARLFVAFLAGLVFLGGGALRLGVRRYLRACHRRGEMIQRTLIVGSDDDAVQLAAALSSAPDSSYVVVGYLDERRRVGDEVDGRPVLGRPNDVLQLCHAYRVGVVVASPAGVSPGTLRDLTIALEGSEVDLAVAPSLFEVVTRRMTIETVGNVPLLHVDQIRLRRGKAALKRTLDLVAASVLGVLTLPIWLAAAVAVRTSSPGIVLFRQQRVGRDGREFTMLKFRTMVADAEERLAEIAHLNEADGHFFKIEDDPRVTPVGRHLRRWSVDELPQLWNVLRGDMSMVGPRPPLPDEVAGYDQWHLRRLRVRPGITGIWQTSGRSDVAFDEAVRMDLFYIENWSLGTDLYLLAKTVSAVLSRRGAR